jgi:hypothetical protein
MLLATAVPAGAEIARLEVTGAAPAGADAAGGAPREAALESAIREGVLRVARRLLGGSFDTAPGAEEQLQERSSDFAVRYRILEDRGERRALLIADPEVTHEYVVEAEVHVDAGRVRNALVEGGWLAPRELGPTTRYELAIAAPVPYRLYAAFLDTLGADREVRSANPASLRRDELRVAIDSALPPRQLVAGLRSELAARGVEIASVTPDRDTLRLTLRAAPEPLEP